MLGAVGVFDMVAGVVNVAELCLRWGDCSTRSANIEALRGHCVVYAQSCATQGAGCTPAGLIAYLMELADGKLDSRGVTVSDVLALPTLAV